VLSRITYTDSNAQVTVIFWFCLHWVRQVKQCIHQSTQILNEDSFMLTYIHKNQLERGVCSIYTLISSALSTYATLTDNTTSLCVSMFWIRLMGWWMFPNFSVALFTIRIGEQISLDSNFTTDSTKCYLWQH